MSRRFIELQHHLCSGCCMWSGMEDVYATKTQQELPEGFFFSMASFGENVYLKFSDEQKPRMFSVGDGRTKVTYNHLKDIVGFTYHISEGRGYEYAMKQIKKEIDQSRPVILGPLDMYHIPYLRMYHRDHIPMHYVLLVGYDEEMEKLYLYDCDRIKLQEISYEDLKYAWSIEKNPVGQKNGFIRFTLNEECHSIAEIVELSLKRKATEQLKDKPEMVGISAFRKIAREFPHWKSELSPEAYVNALKGLPEYWGTVPKLPNRLLGIEEEEHGVRYHGGCDRFGKILVEVGSKVQRDKWCRAGELFLQCGLLFEEITERIITNLCDGRDTLKEVPEIFLHIGELEEKAYRLVI